MANKVKIQDQQGTQVFPITHVTAVLDNYGNSVEQILAAQTNLINQKQLEIGAVPSDLTPTEGSTHWATSGGIYAAIENASMTDVLLHGVDYTGFYIVASTGKWYNNADAKTTFYAIPAGTTLKIKSNSTNYYAIAFLSDMSHTAGTTANFISGQTGVITGTVGQEDTYTIDVDCYLYVLQRATAEMELPGRTPEYVKKSESKASTLVNYELTQDMGINPKGFYIDANTLQWTYTSARTNTCFLFPVKSGDVVTVTPNENYSASVSFIKFLDGIKTGATPTFANGSSGIEALSSWKTYTISEDCYLYILNQAGISLRWPSSISYLGVNMAGMDERIAVVENNISQFGAYDYEGEKPVFTNRFSKFNLVTFQDKLSVRSSAGPHQGGAVYGNYIVLYSYTNATLGIFDITDGSKIAELSLPYGTYSIPHGNALTFGSTFKSSNSVLPLLYVSQWDGERGVFVYDITETGGTYSAELVQVILSSVNASVGGAGYTDWAVDNDNGKLYSVAYTVSGSQGPYDGSNITNPTKICAFSLPAIDATVAHTLGDADVLDSFQILSLPIRQDLSIQGGKMMILRGNAAAGYTSDIHIVDLWQKSVVTHIPLNQFGGESEVVDVYKGDIVLGFQSNAVLSKLTF